jgi:hypothetical protein
MAADNTADSERVAQQRIRQVFEYLKALNDHRNPAIRRVQEQPWHQWLDDLPAHPAVHLPTKSIRQGNNDESTQPDVDYLLCVRRPELTQAPSPPSEIRDWLKPGWDDPAQSVGHLGSRNETDSNGETVTARFDDDTARLASFNDWVAKHGEWAQAEIPARKAMRLFESLYGLYGRLQRDSELYDLVVGDGILSWRRDDGSIYHPLLIERVQLVFDSQVPQFRLIESDAPSEFFTSLFQSIDDVDPRALQARREEFDAGGYHPFSLEVAGFLEGLANQFSSKGRFLGATRPGTSEHPEIGRAPVLFLRSRSRGFGSAIESVIRTLVSRQGFPEALKNIVGVETAPRTPNEMHDRAVPRDALAQDVLFGKAANPEQIRIARQLGQHGAVLVQGPPGTGKSHTIANLIGHLLAEGKSVLVTSHTTKALRVLRGHVAAELQPLCVSVLDSDLDSREQLKTSVHAIGSRLSESDADKLAQEAAFLARRRDELFKKLQLRQAEALEARAAEYRDIVIAGAVFSPSDAARRVAEGRGKHDWIPSPIAPNHPLPLSESDVAELYATNQSTSAEDERYVDEALPSLHDLPAPDDFERSITQVGSLAAEGQHDQRLWPNAQFTTRHIEQIERLTQSFSDIVAEIKELREWQLAAIDAGRRGTSTREPWEHLLGKIQETTQLGRDGHLETLRLSPQVLDDSGLISQLAVARAIRKHLLAGGKLNWWSLLIHSDWKSRCRKWTVNGKAPTSADDMAALEHALEIKIARDELRLLWDGLMSASGGPKSSDLGPEPEEGSAQFAEIIRVWLDWWQGRLQPLIDEVTNVGFDWKRFISELPPDLGAFGGIFQVVRGIETRLVRILDGTCNHLRSAYLKKQIRDTLPKLTNYTRPEVIELRHAIKAGDARAFRVCFERCVAAADRRKFALRRRELLTVLERRSSSNCLVAVGWAKCIRQREGIHASDKPPGSATDAWEWRQLNDELDRRAALDGDKLGAMINQLKSEINETTNQLIDRRAWASQVRNTSLE